MVRPLIFVSFVLIILSTVLFGNKNEIRLNWNTDGISNRDILGVKERFYAKAFRNKNSKNDTIRILAIRVEFQKDDIASTTGNGSFDLSNSSETTIDPPPHNRTYFQHQLTALDNYFKEYQKQKL